MSDPFIAEIRPWAFNWSPDGYAQCDGALVQVSSNAALYALIGTLYGGDGTNTMALPDLRGRVPVGATQGAYGQGVRHGVEEVTLTTENLPPHRHTMQAVRAAPTTNDPAGQYPAQFDMYEAPIPDLVAMGPRTLSDTGGGQPHNNMQPSVVLNFTIAMTGIFPSRS